MPSMSRRDHGGHEENKMYVCCTMFLCVLHGACVCICSCVCVSGQNKPSALMA